MRKIHVLFMKTIHWDSKNCTFCLSAQKPFVQSKMLQYNLQPVLIYKLAEDFIYLLLS